MRCVWRGLTPPTRHLLIQKHTFPISTIAVTLHAYVPCKHFVKIQGHFWLASSCAQILSWTGTPFRDKSAGKIRAEASSSWEKPIPQSCTTMTVDTNGNCCVHRCSLEFNYQILKQECTMCTHPVFCHGRREEEKDGVKTEEICTARHVHSRSWEGGGEGG